MGRRRFSSTARATTAVTTMTPFAPPSVCEISDEPPCSALILIFDESPRHPHLLLGLCPFARRNRRSALDGIFGGRAADYHPLCHFVVRQVLASQNCDRSRRVVAAAGLISVITTLLVWVTLIWIGWALIFSASKWALVESNTFQPAGCVGAHLRCRVYNLHDRGSATTNRSATAVEIATSIAPAPVS